MAGSIAREPEGPDPRRSSGAGRVVVMALGVAVVATAALWVAFTATRPRPVPGRFLGARLLTVDRPFPTEGRFASDPYIGGQACSECHPGEAMLHARSGHALTLRPAGRRGLARSLDGTTVADPEIPEVRWRYQFRDGRLHVARLARDRVEECIAEYAFGSGHHATTFVSVIDPAIPAILEHRLTYFARGVRLGLTPGHAQKPPPPGLTPLGSVPPPRDARNCFACHATELSAQGDERLDESMMIPNIACERCHGPARSHVAAARRGAPESELALPFGPDRWTAEELLRMCGNCHRHPSGPRPDRIRPDDPSLVRFQPIGLMHSKCYQQASGTLSCVTCHDPHARPSGDRAGYDRKCMDCHGGRGAAGTPAGAPARGAPAPAAACPVEPRGRCVECHMPRVDVGHEMLLSDHWIRIRSAVEPLPPTDAKGRLTEPDVAGRIAALLAPSAMVLAPSSREDHLAVSGRRNSVLAPREGP